ncbi:MAG: ethanolamine utilization protein EutN, partial [Planctomycetota bacterium]
MFLGRVIGTVWATRKVESTEGLKLLVVREVDEALRPKPRFVVAADAVQAGLG